MTNGQPEWMSRVVDGSVLREGPNGPLRVVRRATHYGGKLRYVTLAIRRCSWTGRPTTTLYWSDLKARKFSLVPVRPVTLKGDFHARMMSASYDIGPRQERAMGCCEAIGTP